MKVIFLDIDGVMNTSASFADAKRRGYIPFGADGWDERAVKALKKILAKTNALIVISSTWRISHEQPELSRAFTMYNLPPWFDVTTFITLSRFRGKEIKAWLEKHPEVKSYVILDNDSDMLAEQMPFFVQTNFRGDGLTEELADKAIAILNGVDHG